MPAPQPTADDLQQVLDQLARILNQRKTNYALIGGLGAAIRGTVRTTWDIDLLVAVSQIELPPLLESIQQEAFDLDLYQPFDPGTRTTCSNSAMDRSASTGSRHCSLSSSGSWSGRSGKTSADGRFEWPMPKGCLCSN